MRAVVRTRKRGNRACEQEKTLTNALVQLGVWCECGSKCGSTREKTRWKGWFSMVVQIVACSVHGPACANDRGAEGGFACESVVNPLHELGARKSG